MLNTCSEEIYTNLKCILCKSDLYVMRYINDQEQVYLNDSHTECVKDSSETHETKSGTVLP